MPGARVMGRTAWQAGPGGRRREASAGWAAIGGDPSAAGLRPVRLPGGPSCPAQYSDRLLVAVVRAPPLALDRRAGPLLAQAPLRASPSGPGRPARRRGVGHLRQHGGQLVEAVLDVAPLIAGALAGQDQIALKRDAAGEATQEALADVGRQPRRGGDREAQDRLAVDLVDVLAAGAGAARELEAQLVGLHPDPIADAHRAKHQASGARAPVRAAYSSTTTGLSRISMRRFFALPSVVSF